MTKNKIIGSLINMVIGGVKDLSPNLEANKASEVGGVGNVSKPRQAMTWFYLAILVAGFAVSVLLFAKGLITFEQLIEIITTVQQ